MSHYENIPFEVPEGWCWSSIENVCSKFTTGPFGSMVHKSDYVTDGGVPMVNPANMIGGNISYNKLMFVSELRAKDLQRYRLEPSDILLARRGDLTKCVVIKDEQKDWLCGTGSFVLHTIFLLPTYFELLYSSTYIQSILTSESVGATMDNLNQGLLGSIVIPIPPIEEQQRIVTSVGLWFSLIDNIEVGYSVLNQNINKAKAKILDLAIHGKLVPQDPNDEPASELLKRINPKAVASCDNPHYEQNEQEIPVNWSWCKLESLCSFLSRGKSPKYSETDKSYPVFAQKCNLKEGGISLEQARFLDPTTVNKWTDEYKLKTGDVLVNSTGTGTVGRTRLFNESCLGHYPFVVPDSHVSVIRTKDNICSEYIFILLSSNVIQQYMEDNLAGSTNQKELYIGIIGNIDVPLPPYEEQVRISRKVKALYSQLDDIALMLG